MYVFMRVSSFLLLMVFWFESGRLSLQNHAFGVRSMRKLTFAEVGFLMIPGFIFHDSGWAWDQFVIAFVALEAGLKFDALILRSPQILRPARWSLNWLILGF